jgi:hypothetical protein
MRGTGIEKELEICATNITNKTKCMSTHAKEWKKSASIVFNVKKIYIFSSWMDFMILKSGSLHWKKINEKYLEIKRYW